MAIIGLDYENTSLQNIQKDCNIRNDPLMIFLSKKIKKSPSQ